MPINSFLYPGARVVTPFTVANSVRFNNGSSDSLNRTVSSASDRRTFTVSLWCKRSNLGVLRSLIGADSGSGTNFGLQFQTDDTLAVFEGASTFLITTQVFRDPSAWSHFVLAVDTTNSTADNRIRLYHNGAEITSFGTRNNPSQNTDLAWNNNVDNTIGADKPTSGIRNFFDGYLAEVVNIDGSQLTPSSFGQFNNDSPTIWEPIDVTGLTFGNNGFYLDFEDSSALGNDVSGNDNDFTAANLTSVDQSTDTCTNNFATWNSLVHSSTSAVFSEGNLKVVPQDNTSVNYTTSTIAMPQSGKWYAEFKKLVNDDRLAVGIIDTNLQTGIIQANSYIKDVVAGGIIYDSINGKISGNNGDIQTGLTTAGNNDIIGIAVDMDNKLFYAYVNGTLVNSGGSGASFSYLTGTFASFWVGDVSASGYDNCEANFGSPPYSISTGNSDANDYGNFEYAVPSGYYALNTKNLAEFG